MQLKSDASESGPSFALPPHSLSALLSVWAGTFLITALPIVVYYHRFHLAAAFYFLAGDSFYYLDVAQHSKGLPFFSFDGLHPTNGFHPLWQYLLYVLIKLRWFSLQMTDGLQHIFLLNIALVCAGYGLLSVFLAKQTQRFWVAPMVLCPGVAWFCLSIFDSNYLASWSYINGMESGMTLLVFGSALLLLRDEAEVGWKMDAANVLFGFAVLARLDDIFFVVVILGYSLWRSPHRRLRVLASSLSPVLIVCLYLLYNHRTVGVFLPVSGTVKAGAALLYNVQQTLWVFLPSSWEAQPRELTYSMWGELVMRLFQMWFPLVLCSAYLVLSWHTKRLRRHPILGCLCGGAILKALYNLCFVWIWGQGNWYYPISIFTCNAIVAIAFESLLDRMLTGKPLISNQRLRYAVLLLAIAVLNWVCFFGIVSHKAAEHFAQENWDIYVHGTEIAEQVQASGDRSFLELEDGVLAFSTKMPTISGIGLALDPEAVRAQKEGRFFDLLDHRGIHLIVAGGLYRREFKTVLETRQLGSLLLGVLPAEFGHYSIQFQSEDQESGTAIYRIVKR